jgi:hypothetical protein
MLISDFCLSLFPLPFLSKSNLVDHLQKNSKQDDNDEDSGVGIFTRTYEGNGVGIFTKRWHGYVSPTLILPHC